MKYTIKNEGWHVKKDKYSKWVMVDMTRTRFLIPNQKIKEVLKK